MMLRTSLRSSLRLSTQATKSPAGALSFTRGMAEGATGSGSSRAGGVAQGDAFTKREKAGEDKYVKDQEREKLLALREKIKAQRAHLNELDKSIDELSKESGGEQN